MKQILATGLVALVCAGCGRGRCGPGKISGLAHSFGSSDSSGIVVQSGSSRVTTEADGFYSVGCLDVGVAEVSFSKPGYQTETISGVHVTEGGNGTLVQNGAAGPVPTITLAPGRRVAAGGFHETSNRDEVIVPGDPAVRISLVDGSSVATPCRGDAQESADGRWLLCIGKDGTVTTVDPSGGTHVLPVPANSAVKLAPNGNQVLVSAAGLNVDLFSTPSTGGASTLVAHDTGGVDRAEHSPDGTALVFQSGLRPTGFSFVFGEWQMVAAAAGSPVMLGGFAQSLLTSVSRQVLFSPDGRNVLVNGGTSAVHVGRPPSGPVFDVDVASSPSEDGTRLLFSFSEDGTRLAYASATTPGAILVRTIAGEPSLLATVAGVVSSLGWIHGDAGVFIGTDSGAEVIAPDGTATTVATGSRLHWVLSPGRTLAAATDGSVTRIIDMSGKQLLTFGGGFRSPVPDSDPPELPFDPADVRVVGEDRVIHNVSTGATVAVPAIEKWGPGGNLVFTWSATGTGATPRGTYFLHTP